MKRTLAALALATLGLGAATVAPQQQAEAAAARATKAARGFTLTSMEGKIVSLAQFKGKIVVLEWHNPGCPFVRKHYDSGNMQRTQAAAARQGVVWLTINSGAMGKQGYLTAAEAKAMVAKEKSAARHYLFDRTGSVGKAYRASATPHMYVIDGKGQLVYQGAIDDKPTADAADIKGARNHVLAALSELASGKLVSQPTTRAYGCSVKYAG